MLRKLLDWFRLLVNIKSIRERRRDRRRERNCLKYYRDRDCTDLAKNIQNALKAGADDIPVFVVSFNNGIYVKNMVLQLHKFGITPIIIDNCSSDKNTLIALNELKKSGHAFVASSGKNFGNLVGFLDPIYAMLPEVFAYTDPDLQLNEKLPDNFLQTLADLTNTFRVYKAGFALQLLENKSIINKMRRHCTFYPVFYERFFTVREWESQFWRKRLAHEKLDVWAADIDTTFAVYRKSNYIGKFFDAIRVSGDYEAIHLPWFPELDLFSDLDRSGYKQGNISTTWM